MSNARNLANLLGTDTQIQTADIANDAVTAPKVSAGLTQLFGMRNRLINGNMSFNQRLTATYTSNGYTLDRWKVFNSGGTYALTQQVFSQGSLPAFGLRNFMRVVRSSPTGILYLSQLVEDVSYFDNVTVTASFYAKASGAVTLPLRISQEFGSGGSSGVTCGSVSHSVTTTLQRFIGTYTIPSLAGKTIGTNNHLEVTFDIPATTETIEITGVQLEIGSTATAFEYRHYGIELSLCKRYFQYMPALQGNFIVGGGNVFVAGAADIVMNMRATPTGTLISGTDAIHVSNVANYAISSINDINNNYFRFNTTSGAGSGAPGHFNIGSTTLSSEL
jgi:hypothetical protein